MGASAHHRPTMIFCERFECEHTCWDPKDGELCLSRAKPEETLVEARSDTDVPPRCPPPAPPLLRAQVLKAASHHGAPRIYSSQHPQPTLRARKVLTMRTMRRSLWRIPLSTEAIQTFVPSVRGMTVSDKGLAAAVLGMALKKAWGPPGRGPRSVQFPPARLACLCVAPPTP